jgi:hypothetical protein
MRVRCGRNLTVLLVGLVCAGGRAAPGDSCTSPLVVTIPADLPFVDQNQQTCGRGNDYDIDDTCLNSYANGEEMIYQLQVTSSAEVEIVLDPKGQPWTALALGTNCPPAGDGCLVYWADDTSQPRVLDCRYVAPGTYTLMVDCLPTPEYGACVTDFDLTISACEVPLGACCVDLNCIGTLSQPACEDAGGMWHPDFDCATFACPVVPDVLPDTCATAYAIAAVPFSADVETNYAAAGPPAGSCNAQGTTTMQNDVWFHYTPAQAGTLGVCVCYDYVGLTAIYAGSTCADLTELVCLNVGETGTLEVSAGTTYWFQIGDYGINGGGGATLLALSDAVTLLTGDVNCSGSVGFDDINAFVLLLSNPVAWQIEFPDCPLLSGDIDGDGSVNFDDINPFVMLLSGW